MVALPGQRNAVTEEVGRRLGRGGEDLRDIVVGHLQFGLGVGVVGDRHQALALPPLAAERVEVLVPLQLELRTVKRGGRRIRETADPLVVGEAGEHFDRALDILVEAGQADTALRAPVIFEARFVIGQLAVDQLRVSVELAVGFRIEIGLEDQLAELRAGDSLRRVEARLQVVVDLPGQRAGREEIVVVQQRGIGRAAGRPVEAERDDFLHRVFVPHADIERDRFDRLDAALDVASLDLQPRFECRVGTGRVEDGEAERADAGCLLRLAVETEFD